MTKRVEEIFGWVKIVDGFRRTRHRGLDRSCLPCYRVVAAFNLVRLSRLEHLPRPAASAA